MATDSKIEKIAPNRLIKRLKILSESRDKWDNNRLHLPDISPWSVYIHVCKAIQEPLFWIAFWSILIVLIFDGPEEVIDFLLLAFAFLPATFTTLILLFENRVLSKAEKNRKETEDFCADRPALWRKFAGDFKLDFIIMLAIILPLSIDRGFLLLTIPVFIAVYLALKLSFDKR